MKQIFSVLLLLITQSLFAQNDPVLSIDGVNTTFKNGLSLPYWLKSGQTLGLVTGVKSVSILEFEIDSANLKFSKVISLSSTQTVPAGKAWKIEGLGLGISGTAISGFSGGTPSIFTSPKTYEIQGTYDWIVPPGITSICVEAWGAGGAGPYVGALGGGGGAYGYECFSVIPGAHYTVTVGIGGNPSANQEGGDTSLGNLITASGGKSGGNGGIGGTSNAQYNISGGNSIGSTGGRAGNSFYYYGTGGNAGGSVGEGGRMIIYW